MNTRNFKIICGILTGDIESSNRTDTYTEWRLATRAALEMCVPLNSLEELTQLINKCRLDKTISGPDKNIANYNKTNIILEALQYIKSRIFLVQSAMDGKIRPEECSSDIQALLRQAEGRHPLDWYLNAVPAKNFYVSAARIMTKDPHRDPPPSSDFKPLRDYFVNKEAIEMTDGYDGIEDTKVRSAVSKVLELCRQATCLEDFETMLVLRHQNEKAIASDSHRTGELQVSQYATEVIQRIYDRIFRVERPSFSSPGYNDTEVYLDVVRAKMAIRRQAGRPDSTASMG